MQQVSSERCIAAGEPTARVPPKDRVAEFSMLDNPPSSHRSVSNRIGCLDYCLLNKSVGARIDGRRGCRLVYRSRNGFE